ncbi:MAG: VOC family protein [Bacteroidota bacterium]
MKNNLVVVRTTNPGRLADFYQLMGWSFEYHRHGKGPFHYSTEKDGWVFEIYPAKKATLESHSVQLGFELKGMDRFLEAGVELGGVLLRSPHMTDYGIQAIIKDPDGRKLIVKEEGTYQEVGQIALTKTNLVRGKGIELLGNSIHGEAEVGDFLEFQIDKQSYLTRITELKPETPSSTPTIGRMRIRALKQDYQTIHSWNPSSSFATIFRIK